MTIEDLENSEVLSWREKRLMTMGFDPERASEIAGTTLDLYSSSTCSDEAVLHTPPSQSCGERASDPRACPGCGVELPELDAPTPANVGASPACWALYGRLLVYEYSQVRSPRVHRFTVDTYAVQHPGAPQHGPICSVGLHLIGLCLMLERGASARQTTEQLAQMLEDPPPFRWLEPPAPNATITVSDVIAARTPGEQTQLVERWATRTWDAWAPHHAAVHGWIDGSISRPRYEPATGRSSASNSR
jgi:Family of unknown function (DUF5946)